MGKLGKDAKDLLVGNDGSDKEPDDFKTELQKAINKGIISKSDGTLLITSRINADKLANSIDKSQEKGVSLAKDGKVFDSPEEEQEYLKKKEEEQRKRKEKEAAIARKQVEITSEKKENAVSKPEDSKSSKEIEIGDEKR